MQGLCRWWLLALWLIWGCQAPPQQFVGVGDLVAIDVAGRNITIRHDAVVGFAAPATTLFAADGAALQTDAKLGQRVRFVLRQQGAGMTVTDITRLAEGNPGVHDHTPHHGGVVGMIGMTHLEARAERDGRLKVYLTDRYRRPLPLADVQGSVTISVPGGKQTLPLTIGSDALEAAGPAPPDGGMHATVQLVRAGEALDMTFQLPLAADHGGAAGIPVEGCVAPPARGDAQIVQPRCVLGFRHPIGVLATTVDGTRLVIAGADIGVSTWLVETRRFLIGFEPAPAVVLAAPEAPHVEVANAIAVRSDGARALVALESRLLLHDLASGRLIRARTHPNGIVRTLTWAPNGDEVLVTSFYDSYARLIAAEDGQERRRFQVEREAAAVAFGDAGGMVAVASELGPIALFTRESGARVRTLVEATRATRALSFVGTGLVAASDDGTLRWWDLTVEAPPVVLATAAGSALARAPTGTRIASAERDGNVRVYDVAQGALVAELSWHTAPVTALAWAGKTIISADVEGQVAFWDAP